MWGRLNCDRPRWPVDARGSYYLAVGCLVESFEYLRVGHSFLAQEFPFLLHEAVWVAQNRNGALAPALWRGNGVFELWLIRLFVLHLAPLVRSPAACQYLAFSGTTNRTPPLGSATS